MRTREIADLARSLADQIDADRKLPAELVSALRDSGLLRGGAPVEVEGLELAPGTALRCAEEVARGDASAGWCVSIAITSSLLVAYLPPVSRDELFGHGRGVAAGVWAPQGKARPAPGGVVVSGRWAYCSGITHADVMFAGCLLDDRPVVVALPTAELQVLDTWHTLGLRGTGSHDTVADDVFVPNERVISIFDGPLINRPLYRFPPFGFFAACITAAAMGNARAAIEDLVELAGAKKSAASTRTLVQRPTIQAPVAAAESALEAARALYYQSIETAWRASQDEPQMHVQART
ncbi:MAG: acyl-CoA dehydrogenase family protein, partial [Mycobacterium sp.]|nr:acyl-CoA dehydrogenase family protein [Mycobacterium sp.]